MWSDQGFIKLHQNGRAGELVEVSIEHTNKFSGFRTDVVNIYVRTTISLRRSVSLDICIVTNSGKCMTVANK